MTGSEGLLPPGYEFERILGAGGFGEVVLARQISLGRRVAVKRIHSFHLSDESLARFRREGRLLAATNHPAVVRAYDLVASADTLYLVMEYVPGQPLSDLVDAGALPVSRALVILRDVADALATAAAGGIVHRDVKPGNVLVLPSGRAKLGDFGLARIAADPSIFRTQAGPAMGTPAYFPPELSQGDSEPDVRSDAYSFAVLAYEVLVGQRPYDADDVIALISAHWRLDPPDPTTVVEGFPPRAAAALLQGLEKDPSRRLLPTELVDGLSAVPPDAWPDVPRARPGVRPRALPTVAAYGAPPRPATPPPAAKPRRPRRWPAISAAGLLIVALGAGAYRLVGPGEAGPSKAPLRVSGVDVTSNPPSGRLECPHGRITFTAEISTNGTGGLVRFQWTQPDGIQRPVKQVSARMGQEAVRASLAVDVTGKLPLSGDAVIDVRRPDVLSARTPMHYACPPR